jgi:hypothetical protein
MTSERDGLGKVLKDWKATRGPRQLEMIFWRPPYPVARRASAYQRGIGAAHQVPFINAQA